MAAQVFTINPEAFVEALKELPLSAVYGKVSELRNSIAHLHRSNAEMKSFMEASESEEEKVEMQGYIRENENVFASMEERLAMLKAEVERRGQQWIDEEGSSDSQNVKGAEDPAEPPVVNGDSGSRSGNHEDTEEGVYL